MSRLTDTRQAYEKLVDLLDQEIRKRSGSAKDLERFRETLNVAFYLLGWAQFEYAVRQAAEGVIDEKVSARTVERHAWIYLKENIKNLSVRKRLDLLFHDQVSIRNSLDKDYTVRNEAAHNHKLLPKESSDVSAWIKSLEDLVDKFN